VLNLLNSVALAHTIFWWTCINTAFASNTECKYPFFISVLWTRC